MPLKQKFEFSSSRVWLWVCLAIFVFLIPAWNVLAQDPEAENEIYLPLITKSGLTSDAQIEHDHNDHPHIGHIPDDGRFTLQGEQWPPQMKSIDNVRLQDTSSILRSTHIDKAQTATQAAIDDLSVQGQLGNRYRLINTIAMTTKWQADVSQYKVTFFSYSNNATLEVIVKDRTVQSMKTMAAQQYQPPLTQDEVAESVDIAREYWLAQGNTRVNDLEGFAIQTFPTDGSSAYFNTRMTYVSFHPDAVSLPELLTWVDLTSQNVWRSAIEQEDK